MPSGLACKHPSPLEAVEGLERLQSPQRTLGTRNRLIVESARLVFPPGPSGPLRRALQLCR
eukprot:2172844-Alexandrium_andersonii.AAC.1